MSESVADLWAKWRDALAELKRRGVLRSTGGPVGDYAEYLVATAFGLERASYPNPHWDAKSADGTRYSVKARRWSRKQRPTRVRIGDGDETSFDLLVLVLFDEGMTVLQAVTLPISAVRALALGSGSATYTTVGRLLGSPDAVDCTDALKRVDA
jgi:hypothetical protein